MAELVAPLLATVGRRENRLYFSGTCTSRLKESNKDKQKKKWLCFEGHLGGQVGGGVCKKDE